MGAGLHVFARLYVVRLRVGTSLVKCLQGGYEFIPYEVEGICMPCREEGAAPFTAAGVCRLDSVGRADSENDPSLACSVFACSDTPVALSRR